MINMDEDFQSKDEAIMSAQEELNRSKGFVLTSVTPSGKIVSVISTGDLNQSEELGLFHWITTRLEGAHFEEGEENEF